MLNGRVELADLENEVIKIVAECKDRDGIRDKVVAYFKEDQSQERIICFVEYLQQYAVDKKKEKAATKNTLDGIF